MSRLRTLLGSVAIALFLSAPALAQSQAFEKDTDLPVEAPELKVPPAPPKPPESPTTPPETPPPTIYGKDIATESGSLIYVLDISYSMTWDVGQYTKIDGSVGTGDRLDRAKAELVRSIRALPKSFKFNVLAFECETYFWMQDVQPADDENKAKAQTWVMDIQTKSSYATGTGPAVVWALLNRANKAIVLLTDGAPNCGAGDQTGSTSCLAAHLSQIRWANEQHARIDVFGIAASGVFRQWCIDCASQNGGSYTDVR